MTPEEIKKLRGHRSREEMARKMAISAVTIFNWEKGRTRPRGKMLTALEEFAENEKNEPGSE